MWLHYTLLGLVLLGTGLTLCYSLLTGIPPIPSSRPSRKKIADLVPANFDGRIADLGAGWGTVAFLLAKRFPDAQVVAWEISPLPWLYMRAKQLVLRRPNLEIHRGDLLKAPLAGVDVVVCYLYSKLMGRLTPRLMAAMAAGGMVISNTFDVPGWSPSAVFLLDDSFCPEVFVYNVADQPIPGTGGPPAAADQVKEV